MTVGYASERMEESQQNLTGSQSKKDLRDYQAQ